MNDLVVKITGEIIESNFDTYHAAIIKTIKDADKQLVTDADFVEASGTIKTCKIAEIAIKQAKQAAIFQTIDIEKLFAKMDEASEAVRATRLSLEKKIKVEQESRRDDIINAGIKTVEAKIEETANKFPQIKSGYYLNREPFILTVKGKKTITTIQSTINEKVQREIATIEAIALRISSNLSQIEKAEVEFPCLFPEKNIICSDSVEIIKNLIAARIANFKLKQLEAENKKKIDLEAAEQKEADEALQEKSENNKSGDAVPQKQTKFVPVTTFVPAMQKQSKPETVKQEIKTYSLSIEIKSTKEKAVKIAQQINNLLSTADVVENITLSCK